MNGLTGLERKIKKIEPAFNELVSLVAAISEKLEVHDVKLGLLKDVVRDFQDLFASEVDALKDRLTKLEESVSQDKSAK